MPEEEKSAAVYKVGGGPLGLGDPNDRFLRKVEVEVLIPQKMRDKAKAEKCSEEVKKFTECCASSSFAMVYKCRTENSLLKACLTRWYEDDEFKNICREEYLKERSEFRRTGIRKDPRRVGVSM
ncbi:COX assembly mitochondrial protein homolog [Coccinella septempunctata]|uniref:COX assembly mitochondrial protein homolog n=1 Tax=Coccinella septempunctata TaxID=41139 RepID=UPI001D089BF9|nr:COX assembly mitochondrial protein homolog [Coccinella septempunctata]